MFQIELNGKIDLTTTNMVDFKEKHVKKTIPVIPADDNCLIRGLTNSLKLHDKPEESLDLCGVEKEYYGRAAARWSEKYPKLKKHLEKHINPNTIEEMLQDLLCTEYTRQYGSTEERALKQKLREERLNPGVPSLKEPPATTYRDSYRPRDDPPTPAPLMRPQYDTQLRDKLRQINKVVCGETSYQASIGELGRQILKEQPYGIARKEPNYGRWKTPHTYTYWV